MKRKLKKRDIVEMLHRDKPAPYAKRARKKREADAAVPEKKEEASEIKTPTIDKDAAPEEKIKTMENLFKETMEDLPAAVYEACYSAFRRALMEILNSVRPEIRKIIREEVYLAVKKAWGE